MSSCLKKVLRLSCVCLLLFCLLELITHVCLMYLLDEDHAKLFVSLRQYEERQAGNHPFSFQTAFGIYPNPLYTKPPNRHSEGGFRGMPLSHPKDSNAFRIACLGGSTTYDVEIADWTKAWPAQLESVLLNRGYQIEVLNAGVPSWTSREHLLSYATRISYREADLVVLYGGFNDLLFRATWPPEFLPSDYTTPEVLVPDFAKVPWYYTLNTIRIGLILSRCIPPPAYIDPFWCDTVRSQGAQNVLATIPDFVAGYVSQLPSGVSLEEVFQRSGTDFYEHNLRSLATLVAADSVPLLLVGFTMDWDWLEQHATDKGTGLKLGIQQMNQRLRELARDEGIYYFDLDEAMQASPEYWHDFIHNSPSGAATKAALTAEFILKNELVEQRVGNNR